MTAMRLGWVCLAGGLGSGLRYLIGSLVAERFPDVVVAALGNGAVDAVLHFSRRSAEAYLACARRAR